MRFDLSRLEAPPPRSGFYEELWERIASTERSSARRWRMIALVAIAAAVAATAAAGVLAFNSSAAGTVDETLRCPVPDQGGVNLLYVFARLPHEPAYRAYFWHLPRPATVEVDAGRTTSLVNNTMHVLTDVYAGASPTMKNGYTLDEHSCEKTGTIPLSPRGLRVHEVFTKPGGGGSARECWLATTVTVRLRVVVSGGKPLRAQLALVSGRKHRPAAYIEWSPRRVRTWYGPMCHPHAGT